VNVQGTALTNYQIANCLKTIYIYIYTHIYIIATPLQAWTGLEGSKRLKLPEFLYNQHTKVARLSAVHTGHLYPLSQEISLILIAVKRLRRPQGYSAARRITSVTPFGIESATFRLVAQCHVKLSKQRCPAVLLNDQTSVVNKLIIISFILVVGNNGVARFLGAWGEQSQWPHLT